MSLRSLLTRGFAAVAWFPLWLRVAAPFVVMGTIWYLSCQTPTPSPPSDLRSFLHNGAHVVAYSTLAGTWLLARATSPGPAAFAGGWPLVSLVLTTLYGVVDELHQSQVPGRVCSVLDVLTDASAGLLALVLLRGLFRSDAALGLRICLSLLLSTACVAAATWLPW